MPGFLHSHAFGLCFPLIPLNEDISSNVKENYNLNKTTPEKRINCISSSFMDLYQDADPTSCSQCLGEEALGQALPWGRAQHPSAMCMFFVHCSFH